MMKHISFSLLISALFFVFPMAQSFAGPESQLTDEKVTKVLDELLVNVGSGQAKQIKKYFDTYSAKDLVVKLTGKTDTDENEYVIHANKPKFVGDTHLYFKGILQMDKSFIARDRRTAAGTFAIINTFKGNIFNSILKTECVYNIANIDDQAKLTKLDCNGSILTDKSSVPAG